MRHIVLLCFFLLFSIVTASAQFSPEMEELVVECVLDARRGWNVEDEKATEVIDRILQPLGLPRNFLLVRCDQVENAFAFIDEYNSMRYIMYDRQFLERIENFSNHWGEILIIAHEVGHHLSGHTLRKNESLVFHRKMELEADRFAGHMLYVLGASLEETLAIMPTISWEYDDTESTHPNLSKRQLAIQEGYENAKAFEELRKNNKAPTAETYYIMAKQSYINLDYANAMKLAEECLQLNASFAEAFFLRAKCNIKLGQKEDALIDLSRVLSDQPSHTFALSQRGILAVTMQKVDQGCEDLIKACSLGHQLSCDNYQRFCR